MIRTILKWGSIGGIIVAIPSFGTTVLFQHNPPSPAIGMVIGYTTMLVALSTVFIAIKRRRDGDGGGIIGFWPALAIGLGISVVAGIFYCLAWEAALAVTGMDFGADWARHVIATERARGTSGAALARVIAEMDKFRRDYANPFYRLPMTFTEIFPVGVLVSLVSAGLLRNRNFLSAR